MSVGESHVPCSVHSCPLAGAVRGCVVRRGLRLDRATTCRRIRQGEGVRRGDVRDRPEHRRPCRRISILVRTLLEGHNADHRSSRMLGWGVDLFADGIFGAAPAQFRDCRFIDDEPVLYFRRATQLKVSPGDQG